MVQLRTIQMQAFQNNTKNYYLRMVIKLINKWIDFCIRNGVNMHFLRLIYLSNRMQNPIDLIGDSCINFVFEKSLPPASQMYMN